METRDLFKYLRVTDVADAMDGMGYFGIGLMSPEVRPVWLGMKFWGPAVTIRCVPSNRPMWKLEGTEEIVRAHYAWFGKYPDPALLDIYGEDAMGGEAITPGSVLMTATGDAGEVGFWGSENTMRMIAAGAVGIVTDGYCRDTAEVAKQRTPVCCRKRGRLLIPGRIKTVEVNTTVACGGVQVNPGDIVGCDDDGVIVVPSYLAEQVAVHARAILLADMRSRRELYKQLGIALDETVDVEKIEQYYSQFE